MAAPTNDSGDYVPHNILLTGGAGFIGSNVVVHLVKKYPQYKIVNFDKLDYCSSLKNLEEIENAPNYKFVKGDILSADLVLYILEAEKIDTIMHFAASTHVDNSFGSSIDFTKNNIFGTHVLLECAVKAGIKRFVHVSTDEVYGEGQKIQQKEAEALEPTNPYAATKAGAEYLVKAYHRSFGLPIVITRGNNVYGPCQYPEKLIPKMILRQFRGMKCCIHGTGLNRRSYVYVSDVARAFDMVLHKGKTGELYNIGTNFEIENVDVARSIIKLIGNHVEDCDEWLEFVSDRLFNDVRYNIDPSKIGELGWHPVVTFEEGLRLTADWYREHQNNWDSDIDKALVPHPRLESRSLASL